MALWRGELDLVFRRSRRALGAATWSRIHFLDGPVCDGCGQPTFL